MSNARQCDRCQQLFPRVIGAVSFGYAIATDAKGTSQAYGDDDGNDLDLCLECSEKFLAFIGHTE
jgi:hypothetical protein